MSALPSPACPRCGAVHDPASAGLCAVCLFETLAPASDASGAAVVADEVTARVADEDGYVAGWQLGPYEILEPIGRGGMGVVYRARDTRLGRDVAIKVIPPYLAFDTRTRQALDREARVLAELNHPHICAIHDIGHARGVDFIAMEYAHGHTLAERLESGSLTVGEVIRCASELADALAQAHRLGIAHGDLKPANIVLTAGGAKLLDFGLATRHGGSTTVVPSASTADAPRLAGTLEYMSPEQRLGQRADARSDLFAFGLILREMIAAVSERDTVPRAIDRVIAGCLLTNPERRWRSAQDVLVRLRWIDDGLVTSLTRPALGLRRSGWWAASVLVIVGVAAALVVGNRWSGSRGSSGDLLRFTVSPPALEGSSGPARGLAFISPDGSRLAWTVSDAEGRTSLAVQGLASGQVTRLPETDDAIFPFWSPDGRQIAFFAGGLLKTTPAAGGIVRTLSPAPRAQGGTWIDQKTIVFSPALFAPLSRISADGGEPVPITQLAVGETAHQWPVSLDGRHLVYFTLTDDVARRALWMLDLKTGARAQLCAADSGAGYARDGHIVFQRGRRLLAVTVDVGRMRLVGEPVSVVERALSSGRFGPPYFSVASTGTIVSHQRRIVRSQLIWFDRSGRRLNEVTAPDGYRDPALSPDGSEIVAYRFSAEDAIGGLWLLNARRRTSSPLAPTLPGTNQAVWSPDGARVAFVSIDGTTRGLYEMPAHGGAPTLLLNPEAGVILSDWSRDGRFLLYAQMSANAKSSLWVLPVAARQKPFQYVNTPWSEKQARFSPDGRWVAYTSDESGRFEVHIRSFPDSGMRTQISSGGASQPAWRADGRALFYLSDARQVMSVAVTSAGRAIHVETPQALFELPRGEMLDNRNSFSVTPDGRQFLFNVPTNEPVSALTVANVVLNWFKS